MAKAERMIRMKREFLENLGLEKDAVDAVMAEYGRGIEAMKQKCDLLEDQCDALKERVPGLERRISELDDGLSESEEKYSRLINSVIAKAVDDAGFSSVLAGEAAAAVLKEEIEAGNDIYAAIDVMRENDPAAFGGKKGGKPYFSAPPAAVPSGGSGENGFTRRRM